MDGLKNTQQSFKIFQKMQYKKRHYWHLAWNETIKSALEPLCLLWKGIYCLSSFKYLRFAIVTKEASWQRYECQWGPVCSRVVACHVDPPFSPLCVFILVLGLAPTQGEAWPFSPFYLFYMIITAPLTWLPLL